jgi:hypothetical protein
MKVTQEHITVIPEPERREVAVLLAGLRITFTVDEATLLANGLGHALGRLGGAATAIELPPPPAAPPQRIEPAKTKTAAAEAARAAAAARRRRWGREPGLGPVAGNLPERADF